ncbi:hypothetical protein [Mesorhizobium japonicum]|uniref:hypothetical protein n=1 Tax=Mesorhizobium japonicum TaxID=2066070 RepID=UPI001FCB78E6|nr:hypothetical protein [Mesorhizobium japonicum]
MRQPLPKECDRGIKSCDIAQHTLPQPDAVECRFIVTLGDFVASTPGNELVDRMRQHLSRSRFKIRQAEKPGFDVKWHGPVRPIGISRKSAIPQATFVQISADRKAVVRREGQRVPVSGDSGT